MRFRFMKMSVPIVAFVFVGQSLGAGDDFEVPQDFVGPVLDDPRHVSVDEDGFGELDWFDPNGPPAGQFAAEFGVDADVAVELLRWQASLAWYLEELRSLPSYAHSEIVNPVQGDLGGFDVYLKDPTGSEVAFVESIPSPVGGANRIIASEFTKTESETLARAEIQRLREIHGADAHVLVDIDWVAGTVVGRVTAPPVVELDFGRSGG